MEDFFSLILTVLAGRQQIKGIYSIYKLLQKEETGSKTVAEQLLCVFLSGAAEGCEVVLLTSAVCFTERCLGSVYKLTTVSFGVSSFCVLSDVPDSFLHLRLCGFCVCLWFVFFF